MKTMDLHLNKEAYLFIHKSHFPYSFHKVTEQLKSMFKFLHDPGSGEDHLEKLLMCTHIVWYLILTVDGCYFPTTMKLWF